MTGAVSVVRSLGPLRAKVQAWRAAGDGVALVPTMGALHRGHLELVRLAKARCRRAVVSIFVNPTQFAPHEDFERYPRDEAGDLAKLKRVGCDLVWAPERSEMYPDGFATRIIPGGAAEGLESDFRAALLRRRGDGLLQALHPGRARRRGVRREGLSAAVRRAPDGARPRPAAPDRRAGDRARGRRPRHAARATPTSPPRSAASPRCFIAPLPTLPTPRPGAAGVAAAVAEGKAALEAAGFKVDYLDVRDAETLRPAAPDAGRPLRVLVAAWLGRTRLIDNVAA